ncbi:ATP-dependent helicase [Tumebacillus permanentifrigoris]|uniref:DNA 3'-5' helicase n=1 Tax=Tumebacillus permanentifrigoris TaxID=378543 RepID=A0A316DAE4_9BACL|nr:ATP-dependent helicase [Tumebacillus permanentifrigoris]PWK14348.1 DNA helicase-2/ATP-dependent DNA helicase PcrA [Tumebacillus permanentifrigoris]
MLILSETGFFEGIANNGIRLNPEQREAVRHVAGPLVVFAGPGSGKTTVLTCRAAYMMQVARIPANQLLIVTFTRAAAEEMQTRLGVMPGIGEQAVRATEIGTFHSVFLRMLLQQNGGRMPQLLEETEQRTLIRNLLREAGEDGDDEEVADTLQKIGLCKNNLILPARIKATKPENQKFRDLYAGYEKAKARMDRWDFDDILVECYHMLTSNPLALAYYQRKYRYILVDEFQDTNLAQYEVIKLLAGHGNLCIVGDDDQSIYRFRGARVEFLLDFESLYPGAEKVILATNYRSTDPVIETSSRLIMHNRKRQSKHIKGTGREGERPVLIRPEGERDEAEQILTQVEALLASGQEGREIVVLYRTNIQVRAVIDGLVQRNLPFTLHDSDGDFYRRWQVRDVLTYFKLALEPDDLDGLTAIINRPKRYLYPERWVDEVHHIRREQGDSYLEALQKVASLEPYQRQKVEQLAKDLHKLRFLSPSSALQMIRKTIGYDKYLEEYAQKSGNDLKAASEPLEELEQAVMGHGTIANFLQHVAEVNETIRRSRNKGEGIQLMTMHKAKGLEFEHVYCIGLVEEMVPHSKAINVEGDKKDAAYEEERRLLYVGMTRAKRFLTLSAPIRYHGGKAEPSPFLYETALLQRPKKVELKSTGMRDGVPIGSQLGGRYGLGTGRTGAVTAPGSMISPQDRLKLALEKYGTLSLTAGDTLQHRELGTGVIEEIKPLSGDGGRRVLLRFEGRDKPLDVHLELSMYLELMTAPVKA